MKINTHIHNLHHRHRHHMDRSQQISHENLLQDKTALRLLRPKQQPHSRASLIIVTAPTIINGTTTITTTITTLQKVRRICLDAGKRRYESHLRFETAYHFPHPIMNMCLPKASRLSVLTICCYRRQNFPPHRHPGHRHDFHQQLLS